jgi:hypothetical protein
MQKKLFDFFAENNFFAYYLFLSYHHELKFWINTGDTYLDNNQSG